MARAGSRSARLRVRAQVQPADHDRRPARRARRSIAASLDRGLRRSRHAGELGRVRRAGRARRRIEKMSACGRRARHRRADGAVSAEGLGHLAAAVLGHADSRALLREVRHGAGAGRRSAGAAARRPPSSAGRGDSPLAHIPEFVNADVSRLRRSGASRDGHDGHVRRLVVVLLPLLRSEEPRSAVRARQGRVLGTGRLLQRRRRARDPAPDLLALLHARVSRSAA